jgi:hypothetical protein
MGSWTLITGFIIIFMGSVPGPVALAVSIGGGLILFSLSSYLSGNAGSKEA